MKTSLEKCYHKDLDKCLEICKNIGELLPGKQVSFGIDSFKVWVQAVNVDRSEVHKICRTLHRTFEWKAGCSGKKIAYSEGSVQIALYTNIKCKKCEDQRRLNPLTRFFRYLLPHTNWRASIWWSWKYKRLIWVGRGYNPDYTQACIQDTCTGVDPSTTCTKYFDDCVVNLDCAGGSCQAVGSCGCPAALPNSTLFSGCTITCAATGTCARCVTKICVTSCGRTSCLTGTCAYNCDPGFVWNGVACVVLGGGEELFDGYIFLSD